MLQFLLTRLGTMIMTMVVVSLLVFIIAEVVPVCPARNALGRWATEEAVEQLREELGLNQPLWVRYGRWILGCLQGDFGMSIHFHRPVAQLIGRRVSNSVILAAVGFAFMVPLGLALGCLAGVSEGKFLDHVISFTSSFMVSSPTFAIGVFLIVIFSLWLGWLPGTSVPNPAAGSGDFAKKLILPIMTLSLGEIGYLARLTRSTMVEVMDSAYIRTAVLKGIPRRKVIWRHALRNSLIAPFTAAMLHINWLIGGVVVVEVLFNFPGIGRLVLDAAMRNDVPLLEGATLVLTLVAVGSQVVADIGYFLLNPRIRLN